VVVSDVLARKPRRGATATLSLVAVGLLAVALPAWAAWSFWSHDHEMRTDWAITGPPCPVARHSWREVALSRRAREFDYKPMHLAHLFGGADCAAVPEGGLFSKRAYQVCQFTAPAMLLVTAGGRTWAFEPGYGRRATVTLRDGKATCVLAGWFTL